MQTLLFIKKGIVAQGRMQTNALKGRRQMLCNAKHADSLEVLSLLLDLKERQLQNALLLFNPTVQSMLTASLCDWRYSHADVLFIEVLLDLKERH